MIKISGTNTVEVPLKSLLEIERLIPNRVLIFSFHICKILQSQRFIYLNLITCLLLVVRTRRHNSV